MTKMEIVNEIIHFDFNSLNQELDRLYKEDRITGGARYYVYNPFDIYSVKWVSELIDRATASKDYTRYIKRQTSTQMNVIYRMFTEDLKKITDFIEEQKVLPFNQSQKQQLIAKGELSA